MLKKIVLLMTIVSISISSFATPISKNQTVPPILIGVSYNHSQCSFPGNGIIANYDQPGARQAVQTNLAKMFMDGARGIRVIVFHFRTDFIDPGWFGVISSSGGVVAEPHRTNLINYLTDIKNAGYPNIMIAFGPINQNDALERYANPGAPAYDPATFSENFSFIQDVRALVIQHGPQNVKFDLKLESAPYDTLPARVKTQLTDYDRNIWISYKNAYGASDATISAMADAANSLKNLVDLFDASGKGQPDFYMFSARPKPVSTEYGMKSMLKNIDIFLTSRSLLQPIIISESYYNDINSARGISQYMAENSRPVTELYEWPLADDFATCSPPPYALDKFLPLSQHAPVLTTITNAGVNTACCTPWAVWAIGTGLGSGTQAWVKGRIVDANGLQWGTDIPTLYFSSTSSITFRLPKNIPPSGCNIGRTCVIKIHAVDNLGQLSPPYNITLPAQ